MANYANLAPSTASGSLLSLANNAQAVAERIVALCGDVNTKEARALASAIDAVPDALAGVTQAIAQAAALVEDPVYKASYKHTTATNGISAAEASASDALNRAITAAQACRSSLEASFSVKQPNDPMLPFTAGELSKLVEQRVGGNPAQLPTVVRDLLSAAMARESQVEVYCLTSALWPTYSRLGATSDTAAGIRQVIAQVMGAAQSADPDNAGATLLSELNANGGAFVRWSQSVKHLLTSQTQPVLDRIHKSYAAGSMSDGPLAGPR